MVTFAAIVWFIAAAVMAVLGVIDRSADRLIVSGLALLAVLGYNQTYANIITPVAALLVLAGLIMLLVNRPPQ